MFRTKTSAALWLSIISAPVLSIIVFVVTYWIDPLNFSGSNALAAVPALTFSIVALLIGQAVSTVIEIQKAAEYSDRIYGAIKDYLHVTPIGTPEEAIRYISARLPSLREVNNTSFNIENESDRADEKCYNTDSYTALISLAADLCKGGLLWKDIGDPLGAYRLRELSSRTKSSTLPSSTGYRYKLISHNEPQLNFVLLEYKDGSKEVIFNWDLRGIGADPTVLVSRDNQIVEMFSKHFNVLWKSGIQDHDSQPIKSKDTK